VLGIPDFDGLLGMGYTEDEVSEAETKWRVLNNESFSNAASDATKRYSLTYQLRKKEESSCLDDKPPINGYQLHLIEQFNKASVKQRKCLGWKLSQQRALLQEKRLFIEQHPSFRKFQHEDQAAYMIERARMWLEQGQKYEQLFRNKYLLGVWAYVVFLPSSQAASLDPLLSSADHTLDMIQEKMTGNIFEKYCDYRSAFNTFEHFCIWRVKNRIADFKSGVKHLKENQMPSESYQYLYNVHLPYRELLQRVLYLNCSGDESEFNTAIHFVENILRLSYLDQSSGQINNIRPWIRLFEQIYEKVRFTRIYQPKDNYRGPLSLDFSAL